MEDAADVAAAAAAVMSLVMPHSMMMLAMLVPPHTLMMNLESCAPLNRAASGQIAIRYGRH